MEEPLRILFVDDEKNVLRAIERLFLDEGYEILTATSGSDGLDILGRVSPLQIVISDYRMPGMNGVEFLREVRERWPETVRIVLSGYADTVAVVAAINEGQIYKFIPKPWNDDELKVTISNAVDRYFLYKRNIQLTDELRRSNEELGSLNERLDELVEKRVAKLIGIDNIQAFTRNVLDLLPVAVVGMDGKGALVMCNRRGNEMLFERECAVPGLTLREALPASVNLAVDKVFADGRFCGDIFVKSRSMRTTGALIKYPDGKRGVILVLEEEKVD
jgi:two-component system, NtrC family, sensor kinase